MRSYQFSTANRRGTVLSVVEYSTCRAGACIRLTSMNSSQNNERHLYFDRMQQRHLYSLSISVFFTVFSKKLSSLCLLHLQHRPLYLVFYT